MGNCLNIFKKKKYKTVISKKNKLIFENNKKNINSMNDSPKHSDKISDNDEKSKSPEFVKRSVINSDVQSLNLNQTKKSISLSDIDIDNDCEVLGKHSDSLPRSCLKSNSATELNLLEITENLKKDIKVNFDGMKNDLNNTIKDKLKMIQKINDERIKDKFESEIEDKEDINFNFIINEKIENLNNEFTNLNTCIFELIKDIKEIQNEKNIILHDINKNYINIITHLNIDKKSKQNGEVTRYSDTHPLPFCVEELSLNNVYLNNESETNMNNPQIIDDIPKNIGILGGKKEYIGGLSRLSKFLKMYPCQNNIDKNKLNNLKSLSSSPIGSVISDGGASTKKKPLFNKYV